MFKNLHKYRKNRGVTMVELIVVIAIVAILSGMMFFDYGKFKSSTSLQNLADDIALSVRKAQMYAIGAHGTDNEGIKSFDYGYGVHFTKKAPTSNPNEGSNKAFILFVDMNTNSNNENGYDYDSSACGNPSDDNECLEILSITGADYISEITGIKSNGGNITFNNANDVLDIVYTRPNTAPTICHRNNPSNACGNNKMSQVTIKVANDANPTVTKTVTIYNNGQISVS